VIYLLDANVFIQAKNLHYGLDFCPAFWEWLIESSRAQKVFSIDKVADEIAAGADEVTDWLRENAGNMFLVPLYTYPTPRDQRGHRPTSSA